MATKIKVRTPAKGKTFYCSTNRKMIYHDPIEVDDCKVIRRAMAQNSLVIVTDQPDIAPTTEGDELEKLRAENEALRNRPMAVLESTGELEKLREENAKLLAQSKVPAADPIVPKEPEGQPKAEVVPQAPENPETESKTETAAERANRRAAEKAAEKAKGKNA